MDRIGLSRQGHLRGTACDEDKERTDGSPEGKYDKEQRENAPIHALRERRIRLAEARRARHGAYGQANETNHAQEKAPTQSLHR